MSNEQDLDALFGALDGEPAKSKDATTTGQPPSKRARVDEKKDEAVSDSVNGHGTAKDDDANGDNKAPATTTFSSLMHKPSLSSATGSKKPQQPASEPSAALKQPPVSGSTSSSLPPSKGSATSTSTSLSKSGQASEGEPEEETREIATGTSHDKTVRTYTAIPKQPQQQPKRTAAQQQRTTPAKTYPFPLDPFQQAAISYLDQDESVLVAAHTSAGKTAIAEYAIALALQAGQRVVYTSPIKALSNQKFRDLQDEFNVDGQEERVGLMTGDVTIHPDAPCLVMTTEILRSMLYRGSELLHQVQWVIYDEVHYMRDVERGVVWEESIVLLPHQVRFVFLSATIPNASQFADWIAAVHHQPCHVVYTNYRPTPLQHYIFPQGGEGLYLVVDERGKFRQANFQKAMATLQQQSTTVDGAIAEGMLNSGNGKKKQQLQQRGGGNAKRRGMFGDLHRIVKLIMERNLNPVIVFSFSKKDCERFALALQHEDYNDDVEKDLITQVYNNAIDSLSADDRQLPQVEALLPLLKRGIGIHHGGLLPILKEIVEILFSEGLIKALFATETFSIGINMPAKTVVFTNTRKWDGQEFRYVSSGEYIQMSGRAGRRGKDDRGIVIQMVDEKMEPAVCKNILYGEADPLNSSYRLTYNMLLNLMRVEDVDPEYLLRASFYQFQREQNVPKLLAQAKEKQAEAESVDVGSAEDAELAHQYYQMDQQLLLTRRKIAKFVRKPEYILKFLQNPGRFLDISINDESFGWGVLVSCKKKQGTGAGGSAGRLAATTGGPDYTLEVLLHCVDRHFDNVNLQNKGGSEDAENASMLWRGTNQACRPPKDGDPKKIISMRVFTVGLENIERVSAVRIHVPSDVHSPQERNKVSMSIKEVNKRFPDGVPLLDPSVDMNIKDEAFHTLLKRAEALTQRLATHKFATDYSEESRLVLIEAFEKKNSLLQESKALKEEANSCQTITLKDDMKKMKRVLKRLGHVDANGVIQTKGRTACEINTATELVVVELMFTGVFNDLSVEQCVALLSVMTFDERNRDDDDPTKGLKSHLLNPFLKLQEIARTVVRVEIACGIEVDEDEFVEQFNPGIMEAVYAWCKGAKFIQVQQLTGSFEGTTIRTLRRLEELVRQITTAAKAIGNHELQEKFEKGGELLKRDIVFCSSLYL